MPKVEDKPLVHDEHDVKTLERPVIAPPPEKKAELPRRPERYMRWLGWLVAFAVVAVAVTVTAVVLTDDEPVANLAATLEARRAKDAIEEHQQAIMAGVPGVSSARSEQLVRKDALEQAAIVGASGVPGVSSARSEQLGRKDALEETNAALFGPPAAAGFAAMLDTRLAKEAIEDSRQVRTP